MAVRGALIRERRRLGGRHVFEPVGCFLDGPRADIFRDEGLRADLAEEVEIFLGAEAVRLDYAAPVRVERRGPFAARPDAASPMIIVTEASTRPAHVRDLNRAQRAHDVGADAADIGNG